MNPNTNSLPVCAETQVRPLRFAKIAALAVVIAAAASPIASATGLLLETNSLTIAPTGQLNLKDNAMIWYGGNIVTANGYLSTGLNLSALPPGSPTNGWSDGYGINSSVAAGDGGDGTGTLLHAIGGIRNELDPLSLGGGALFGVFQGKPVTENDLLFIYTCAGDADLDGFITSFDQFLLDNGVANSLGGWINGDFDYDGSVTSFDQFLLDNSVALGCVPPPAPPLAGGAAAVPEPGTASLMMVGLLGFAARRSARRSARKASI